jgi:hypothetical protein
VSFFVAASTSDHRVCGKTRCAAPNVVTLLNFVIVSISITRSESAVTPTVCAGFNDDSTPNDPAYEKRSGEFLDDVVWFADAISAKKAREKKV